MVIDPTSPAAGGDQGIYVAGNTMGNMAGTNSFKGAIDGYIRKYNSSGSSAVWSAQIGTIANDDAQAIDLGFETTGALKVFVAGSTSGDLDGRLGHVPACRATYLKKFTSTGAVDGLTAVVDSVIATTFDPLLSIG